VDAVDGRSRWLIGGLLLGYVWWVASAALGDTLSRYVLQHPDSFDWLVNGLRYAGVPVVTSWRAVLQPFIYAVLFRLQLENAIPLLGGLWMSLLVVGLLTVGWRAAGWAAVAAAALAATDHLILGHGLTIGSDVASATLGLLGVLALYVAVARGELRWCYVAAVALALCQLTQPFVQFLVPGVVAVLFYDPDARFGIGLGPARRLARSPHAWAAVVVGCGVLGAAYLVRARLIGMWWPKSEVLHMQLLGLSVARVPFYLWCTAAAWSIPTTALVLVGAVAGIARPARRGLTLALLGTLAGPFVFFTFCYAWSDNRFVVYWSLPAFVLAGLGVTALGRRAGVAALVVALLAGNLTVLTEIAPGHEPVLSAWPTRSWRFVYVAHRLGYERVEPVGERARLFRRTLERWAAARRKRFDRRRSDDIYYGRDRELVGRLASHHLSEGGTLFVHFGPAEYPVFQYILRNQFALYSHRRIVQIGIDPADPATVPHDALVALRRPELDRLRAAGLPWDRFVVVFDGGPWVLIRGT
jgi:hypothetical protein